MALNDLSVFQVLKSKMLWHQKRQGIIAQNIANADTPKYKARDLAKFQVSVADPTHSSVTITRTQTGHMDLNGGAGSHGESSMRDNQAASFEVRPSGTAVSLEEQSSILSQNAMQYQESAALMKRVIGMYRTALGRR